MTRERLDMDASRTAPGRCASDHVTGRELRRREEEVAEWSTLLLSALQATSALPAEESAAGASGAWRPPVGVLTRGERSGAWSAQTPRVCQAAEGAAQEEPNEVRLQLNVGRLGEIALLVERGSDGLRVLLSAARSTTTALLESERQALHQALVSSGLRVELIRFVTMGTTGTRVASGDPAAPRHAGGKAASEFGRADTQKRRSNRLKVVG